MSDTFLHSPTPDDAPDLRLDQNKMPPRFAFGQVVGTPGAIARLEESGVGALDLLERHGRGDWGDLDAEDKAANDAALIDGGRLFSAYNLPKNGGRVWVITEADRSATTFLLPEEY